MEADCTHNSRSVNKLLGFRAPLLKETDPLKAEGMGSLVEHLAQSAVVAPAEAKSPFHLSTSSRR